MVKADFCERLQQRIGVSEGCATSTDLCYQEYEMIIWTCLVLETGLFLLLSSDFVT